MFKQTSPTNGLQVTSWPNSEIGKFGYILDRHSTFSGLLHEIRPELKTWEMDSESPPSGPGVGCPAFIQSDHSQWQLAGVVVLGVVFGVVVEGVSGVVLVVVVVVVVVGVVVGVVRIGVGVGHIGPEQHCTLIS